MKKKNETSGRGVKLSVLASIDQLEHDLLELEYARFNVNEYARTVREQYTALRRKVESSM